jgi:hypothetical protein
MHQGDFSKETSRYKRATETGLILKVEICYHSVIVVLAS